MDGKHAGVLLQPWIQALEVYFSNESILSDHEKISQSKRFLDIHEGTADRVINASFEFAQATTWDEFKNLLRTYFEPRSSQQPLSACEALTELRWSHNEDFLLFFANVERLSDIAFRAMQATTSTTIDSCVHTFLKLNAIFRNIEPSQAQRLQEGYDYSQPLGINLKSAQFRMGEFRPRKTPRYTPPFPINYSQTPPTSSFSHPPPPPQPLFAVTQAKPASGGYRYRPPVPHRAPTSHRAPNPQSKPQHPRSYCIFCRVNAHPTSNCPVNHRCFNCARPHRSAECTYKAYCPVCSTTSHRWGNCPQTSPSPAPPVSHPPTYSNREFKKNSKQFKNKPFTNYASPQQVGTPPGQPIRVVEREQLHEENPGRENDISAAAAAAYYPPNPFEETNPFLGHPPNPVHFHG